MSSYSFHGRKRVWTPRDEEENRAIYSAIPQDTGIRMPKEFKPVYLENVEHVVEKWNLTQMVRLLRLYGSHRCLWDIGDLDNKNRKLRKAALLDITAAMNEGMTVDQVLQKINVLRGTYRYEKRRIKQRMRRGLGASTKLKWFGLADAFLRNMPRAEKLKKNTIAKEPDSDLEEGVVFAVDPEVLNPLEENEGTQDSEKKGEIYHDLATFSSKASSVSTNDISCKGSVDCFNSRDLQNDTSLNTSMPCQVYASSKLHQRPWTCVDSILFVQLLKEKPILWKNNSFISSQQVQYELDYQSAAQQIANTMKLSIARIAQRLRMFKLSYAEEKQKVKNDPGYKPNLIWFNLAETFMNESTPTLEVPNFVDLNCLPPLTPNGSFENKPLDHKKVGEQEDDENDRENFRLLSPINPIPSVVSPSLREFAQQEALKALFYDGQSEDKVTDMKLETSTGSSSLSHDSKINLRSEVIPSLLSNSATKLMWNGLEDDLLEGKWSLKHSVKFLRLYGSHRCLWDLNDPNYRSRALRNAAIEDIAAAMGYGLNAAYVAKKIKIFRITYMQHRKRMLKAYKEGKADPEIQLRWFPLADCFLRSHIGLRCIKDSEREMPQFDHQFVYANLNLIDPALLNDLVGKGTQNSINIGDDIADKLLQ